MQPYSPGEELIYRVFYVLVPAGVVTMNVEASVGPDGRDVYKFAAEANSSFPFSYFYRVRNRMESYVDVETFLPVRFEKRRQEASFRKERHVSFDRQSGTAYVRGGRKNTETAIPDDAQDYLSSLYHLRGMELEVGRDVYFNATSGENNYRVEILVLRKEQVRKWGRELDTIVVQPVVSDFVPDGIMKDRPDMLIWLTDDDKRIPLRIEVDTNFGRLNVVLVNYREGEPADDKHTGN